MKLIDKSALVAEITKRAKEGEIAGRDFPSSAIFSLTRAYKNVLSFLDTLEVKDVDLEKEIKDYFNNQPIITRSKGIDYQLIPSGEELIAKAYKDSEESGREYKKIVDYVESILENQRLNYE